MILTGNKIKEEIKEKRIIISPFDERRVTTNSYDLCLAPKILRYTSPILDPKIEQPFEEIEISKKGLQMNAGEFRLAASIEIVGSNHFVPIIHAKSSLARMGLFVHCTADLVDIGSVGNITFQLFASLPIILYPEMLIGQVSFWVPLGDITLYKGKYQNSSGPQPSKSWMEYLK